MINMKFKGGKEVHALLQQLPVQVETKILRQALSRGANIVRDEARALVPAKSGKLRKSIKTSRNTTNGQVIAKVRLKGKHSYLGRFIEYGVGAHFIANTGKGEGRAAVKAFKKGKGSIKTGVMKIGDNFVSGVIWHPGHAAHPFMRPALDTKATEVVNTVGEYLHKYLQFGNINVPAITVDEEE